MLKNCSITSKLLLNEKLLEIKRLVEENDEDGGIKVLSKKNGLSFFKLREEPENKSMKFLNICPKWIRFVIVE